MSQKIKPTKKDAIRMVLDAGGVGDYCDVADQVKKRFGLTVGEGLVEKTHLSKKREVGADNQVAKELPVKNATQKTSRVLDFVTEMGGFDNAKEAIVELEQTLRRLM